MQEKGVISPSTASEADQHVEDNYIIASKFVRLLHQCRLCLSPCRDDDVNWILLFILCDQNTKFLSDLHLNPLPMDCVSN